MKKMITRFPFSLYFKNHREKELPKKTLELTAGNITNEVSRLSKEY